MVLINVNKLVGSLRPKKKNLIKGWEWSIVGAGNDTDGIHYLIEITKNSQTYRILPIIINDNRDWIPAEIAEIAMKAWGVISND